MKRFLVIILCLMVGIIGGMGGAFATTVGDDMTFEGAVVINGTLTQQGAFTMPASSVGSAEITDGSITGTDIADATITNVDIATGGVNGTNILDSTITGADIASATITNVDIATGGVNGTNILDATITQSDMAVNSIGVNQLIDNTQVYYVAAGAFGNTVTLPSTAKHINSHITAQGENAYINTISFAGGTLTMTINGAAGAMITLDVEYFY